MTPYRVIRVRYGMRAMYPILMLLIVAFSLRDTAFTIIAVAISLLLLPLAFRPFLLVENGRARFVSLMSDSISREIELSALRSQLPSMRWMLRRSDLIELEFYLANCR
ncbi:hypothetical protein JIN84_15665 [Luteolibacter yonseiensis]|uniref:Uncharacterized protein n=1 Tax=Luteolibacter yonseiensis TaxID=1144680 RepID=A0A934R4M0_9BACT|nr:hypothetical protein [Luteolibacter yonseiensis]MBK1817061.1 hypothetical protein [Luteolibacter yonseiensis]